MQNGWKTALLGVAGALLMVFLVTYFQSLTQTADRVFDHEKRITTLEKSVENTEEDVKDILILIQEMSKDIKALREQPRR